MSDKCNLCGGSGVVAVNQKCICAYEQSSLAAMPGLGTVYTTHHMCVDIAGVLRWPDKDLCRLFKDDDGSKKPGRLVRDWLKLQLAQGKRVLPMGEKCEGWSDVDGCPGHPRQPDEIESPNDGAMPRASNQEKI